MQTELNKVITALQEFYARETFLFEKELGERALTHRLAVHLEGDELQPFLQERFGRGGRHRIDTVQPFLDAGRGGGDEGP